MAHIIVAPGKGPIVPLDGFTINAGERLNVDPTLPVTAARIADGTLVQEDSVGVPSTPRGLVPVVKDSAVSDADFPAPPPVGTLGFDRVGLQLYIKVKASPSTWRKSPAWS